MHSLKEIFFNEAAVDPKEMYGTGLGLQITKNGGTLTALLYKAELFNEHYKTIFETEILKNESQKNAAVLALDAVTEDWNKYAVSYIFGSWVGKCGAFQVKNSAANKGYGPFIYDVAGSIFGWVVSDRSGVSNEARKVWKWMFDHPELYERKSISDKCSFDPPSKEHIEYLNFAYKPRRSKIPDIKNLILNHKKIEKNISKYGLPVETITNWMIGMGEEMFNSVY